MLRFKGRQTNEGFGKQHVEEKYCCGHSKNTTTGSLFLFKIENWEDSFECRHLDLLSKATSEADTATRCQLCPHMFGLHHLKIVITAFTLNVLMVLASHKFFYNAFLLTILRREGDHSRCV